MSKNKDKFHLDDYTFREFQTFLIILSYEGKERGVLKTIIDKSFQHKSRTKGYDYINDLCKKGLTYKKASYINGKKQIKVFVKDDVRKKYEKFIIPTILDVKATAKDLLQDKLREINNFEIIREKFKNYTEHLIIEIKDLIGNTSASAIKKKRFLKTIENKILTYFKAEMLKYTFLFNKENN